MQNFLLFCTKNLFFLFYTLIFTKYPHQFIYSTHLFNKIFIIFPFFTILSLTTFLSHTQSKRTETHLPQNNSLSLTDPNHHHTNHQILAPTKHSFITLIIPSFIASSLQWVPKVDPPLLRLRSLIEASSSSHQSRRWWRRRHVLRPNLTKILESWRRQSEST